MVISHLYSIQIGVCNSNWTKNNDPRNEISKIETFHYFFYFPEVVFSIPCFRVFCSLSTQGLPITNNLGYKIRLLYLSPKSRKPRVRKEYKNNRVHSKLDAQL